MNLLPTDLKNLIYLYLPYPEVLNFYNQNNYDFWAKKAQLTVGEIKFKRAGNAINHYIEVLALYGLIVPGSELYVCDSEILRYAITHNDYNLAKYIVEKTNSENQDIRIYMTEDLCKTSWIDLLKILETKGGVWYGSLNCTNLVLHNTLEQVHNFNKDLGKWKRGGDYKDAFLYYIPVVMGLEPPISNPLELEHLIYLAIVNGQDQLAKELEKKYSGINNTPYITAWIQRNNWNQVEKYLHGNFRINTIGKTLSEEDNLDFLQRMISVIPQWNIDLLGACLAYSIYGSKIFTWIVDNQFKAYLITPELIATKTYLDFAGLNYLLRNVSPKEVKNLLNLLKEDISNGTNQVCQKVFNYIQKWTLSS